MQVVHVSHACRRAILDINTMFFSSKWEDFMSLVVRRLVPATLRRDRLSGV